MNLLILSFTIGMITCFLEGPLVVIWMQGLGLEGPLMMLLIWSISLAIKIEESKLDLFYFYFLFLFYFQFIFYFLFLEQLWLGLISHTVTSVTT